MKTTTKNIVDRRGATVQSKESILWLLLFSNLYTQYLVLEQFFHVLPIGSPQVVAYEHQIALLRENVMLNYSCYKRLSICTNFIYIIL